MPRMEKGSPEAIAFGKKMKALREGKAKISRPAVSKGKPEPAKMTGGKVPPPPSRMSGGKVPSPPSRSYDTSQEDDIVGIILKGGSLKDCPTCCGCGIVKLKGK